ncbi:TetR/AcrR family transcriptional regulator [Psychroserpens sp. SPM9]|uniref:TetR/AcrR family transcriptional regulator n=1 Tax=Psychroserpens sp. SPM9 TaxID=2975598 RepID=UPI0021A45FCD|nr:TetR/AcrR family transcriptional regulator [Psychroserpens sp. SPM9]MDG5492894.1 TetR/AcrR family transcriptional regulator [Psychroserpens sp. SPM9]
METTKEHILEKVAPIFNQKGYVATSMSDITNATNLTKGAIYCNFKNKEELALEAFRLNLKKAIYPLQVKLKEGKSSIDKLFILTEYYRGYYDLAKSRGGCPILNAGVDAKFTNTSLYNESKKNWNKLVNGLAKIIEEGKDAGEIKQNIIPDVFAQKIFAMIEGGVFMSIFTDDKKHLINIMDTIEEMIKTQFVK